MELKRKIVDFLKWTEKYTRTDMVYAVGVGFWWITGRIFSFLASFLILFFFARFAPKEVYGAYTYILSMAAIFGLFALVFIS